MVSGKTGVGGREVPGATLIEDGPTKAKGNKKKKKGGKRHRKSASVAKTVQSDSTLVDERGENERQSITSDEQHGEPESPPPPPPQPQRDVDEAASEATVTESKQQQDEEKIDELTSPKDEYDPFSPLSPVDDSKVEANTDWQWTPSPRNMDYLGNDTRTPADWADTVVGDMVERTDADGTQHALDHTETRRQTVAEWFYSQPSHHYRNLSAALEQKAVEHLLRLAYPELHDAEWTRSLRLIVWRAVVRANFFWIDPLTKIPGGKPKPILRPAGVFENHFEAFVDCASERLDRINRDLPSTEYVKKVEDEVRNFLMKVEYAGRTKQLQHLAFLLLFEENQRKSALTLEDMQERIRRAFSSADLALNEFEFMRRGMVPQVKEYASYTVTIADAIWKDAIFEL